MSWTADDVVSIYDIIVRKYHASYDAYSKYLINKVMPRSKTSYSDADVEAAYERLIREYWLDWYTGDDVRKIRKAISEYRQKPTS